ncbi:hypothetical protein M436DRAFT_83814 [Aureobasidium namibiae CBS 147.97]|uniref:Genetic interactor of prohibitins 3, mitochondrial n=1 Tax=Aureobasidium namibiae CBS 147.97 TaxID=1043004 RepID=A0A074XA83_9PEZI
MYSRVAIRSRNALPRIPLVRSSVHAAFPSVYASARLLNLGTKRLSSTETIPPAHHQHDLIQRKQQEVTQKILKLPLSCPGCGAPSQTVASEEAGFYNLSRSAVRKFVHDDAKQEDLVFQATLDKVDSKVLQELGLDKAATAAQEQPQKQTPICDRCHNLLHHHTGVPIFHPSIDSIRSIIEDSPHKNNHIYHIIDAADFPMSLIPNLLNRLDLPSLRTQNRRSKHKKYVRDRVADVSFIITRSDLLAPNKEQVDSLMPYLRETLRDALGRTGRNVRLGNMRCVSAKRGWWTKEVKEDIWDRGGAAWMVGKVNVGKSNLFEVAFPKGRGQEKLATPKPMHVQLEPETSSAPDNSNDSLSDLPAIQDTGIAAVDSPSSASGNPAVETHQETVDQNEPDVFDVEEGSLLPPAQLEVPYPVMPVISSLPGTTASPIRVPFGSGKGELIDLPGVSRSNLDEFVLPEHHQDLVMRSRVTPEQMSIKPGQSLVLGGGLIRITPTTPDLVFLSYTFLPLHPHMTSTDKAVARASGERATGLHTIMTKEARESMASAGTFKLEWDVTKQRAGPLTSKSAAKLKPEQLPFKVFSADIVVEGVGWVELVAQVRKSAKHKPAYAPPHDEPTHSEEAPSASTLSDSETTTWKPLYTPEQDIAQDMFPRVEVFSPKGKFIAVRPPMVASLLGGKKAPTANTRKSRPRMSMKSLKHSQRGREAQKEG